tara:strand:+ start:638 stop:1033 length:396 start_codon:yes stop_codon:yes gene_type:complete
MITMGSAIVFLIGCISACIFFKLGRFTEKLEKKSKDRDKRVEDLLCDLNNNDKPEYDDILERSIQDNIIIDAEYEDVVFDLDEYRKRKTASHSQEIDGILEYEMMYYKKTNEYIKLPKEIADLIRYIKKKM